MMSDLLHSQNRNEQSFAPVKPLFTVGQVAKYSLLPGIFPRLRRLAGCLSSFLYMFTQILGTAGLIERNHPCLRYENRHAYPFSYVISLAWQNVRFDKNHIPQTGIFIAVILSLLLLTAVTLGLLGRVFLTVDTVRAQTFGDPTSYGWIRNEDWAFRFLDRIFGDGASTGIDFWTTGTGPQNPWFTNIFIGMLQHYSLALIFIAAAMILYLLIITISESARTGKPFGERFDSVWTPVRMVMAIGLLIPLPVAGGAGYNGAQLIVFQASEWGSNLATNIWHAGLTRARTGRPFVAIPAMDKKARFIHDMLMINLCVHSFDVGDTSAPEGSATRGEGVFPDSKIFLTPRVYMSNSNGKQTMSYGVFIDSDFCGQAVLNMPLRQFENRTVTIGGYSWEVPDMDHPDTRFNTIASRGMTPGAIGVVNQIINRNIRTYMKFAPYSNAFGNWNMGLISGTLPNMNVAEDIVSGLTGGIPPSYAVMQPVVNRLVKLHANKTTKVESEVTADVIRSWVDTYEVSMGYPTPPAPPPAPSPPSPPTRRPYVNPIIDIQPFNDWLINGLATDARYGWTTAGVFYLRLSNGFAILQRAAEGPVVKKLPKNYTDNYAVPGYSGIPLQMILPVCSSMFAKALTLGAFNDICSRMEASTGMAGILRQSSATFVTAPNTEGTLYARLGGSQWADDLAQPNPDSSTNVSAESYFSSISSAVVGAVKLNSNDINPLGQVIRWGETLMNIASMVYFLAIIGGVYSPAISDIGIDLGHAFLIPGFTLAFFIPMMPFIYFMFAVIEWIVSVVEAVIGVPLWCLSFISLQGDALGKSIQGVKMIFELVLRPSIIVFSLLVSIIVFTASIQFVNDSFSLFLGAFGTQGSMGPVASAIGGFAMMLVYMFLIYSLATSCFKLIDVIPNQFGRWLELPAGLGSRMKMGADAFTGVVAGAAVVNSLGAVAKAPGGLVKEKRGRDKQRSDDQKMNNMVNNTSATIQQNEANFKASEKNAQARHDDLMNRLP